MIQGGKVTYSLFRVLGADIHDRESNRSRVNASPQQKARVASFHLLVGDKHAKPQKGEEICSSLQPVSGSRTPFHPKNSIPYAQPDKFHALTVQKGANKIMPLNPPLDLWQVATPYSTLLTTYLFRRSLCSVSQHRQWRGRSHREWPEKLFIRAQGSCVWNDSTLVLTGVTFPPGTHFSLPCRPRSLNQDSDLFTFFTFSLSLLEEALGHL